MRAFWAGVFAFGLIGPALAADFTDFVGTWSQEEGSSLGGLFGTADESVARIVVTPQGVGALRIHLYGRCKPACDWGSEMARPYYESASSSTLRAFRADFKTANSIKHLTLRPGAGKALRFELATEFTDHSGRRDYEAAGSLRFVPPAAPVAGSPPAGPSAVTAPLLAEAGEDCERIDPQSVFMAPGKNGGWVARDYNHVIVDFGSDKVAAAKAVQVLKFYRFDEHCFIARPKPKMTYWRVAGQFPRDPMPGETCSEIQPGAIAVQGGKVLSASQPLLDFGEDASSARRAAAVLKGYRITRQCVAAKPNGKMVYWLAR